MVLCIAKPTPGCACVFTALLVAFALVLVCMMILIQAGLAAQGHVSGLDFLVPTSRARIASSMVDFALASEREALYSEVRNATSELRTTLLSRLDEVQDEFLRSRQQEQREVLRLLENLSSQSSQILQLQSDQHSEVLATIERLSNVNRAQTHQLRTDLLNISIEHSREISDLLMEQLKTLENIKGKAEQQEKKEEKKKKSAIGEGLWGFITSVREEAKKEEQAKKEETKKQEEARKAENVKKEETSKKDEMIKEEELARHEEIKQSPSKGATETTQEAEASKEDVVNSTDAR